MVGKKNTMIFTICSIIVFRLTLPRISAAYPQVCKSQLYGLEHQVCSWAREEVPLPEGLLMDEMHSFKQ